MPVRRSGRFARSWPASVVLLDERPQRAEQGGKGRNVNCRRYDRCLDHTIERGWEGFDCGACSVMDEYTADELRAEGARIQRRWGLP
jgi:hypothetical protein